jgi:hypothetical protein
MKMRRFLAVAAGAAALTASMTAHAASPTVTVTPSTGLSDGQTVMVSGTNFRGANPNQPLTIVECGGAGIQFPNPDGTEYGPVCTYDTNSVSVQADRSGNFGPVPFTVHISLEGIQYNFFGETRHASHECLPANDCFVRVVTNNLNTPQYDNQAITFTQ